VVAEQRSERRKSRSAGAIRGLIWGVSLGAAVALLTISGADECDNCTENDSKAEWMAAGVVGGAIWGAGIGAIVGRERWDSYQLQPRTVFSVHEGRPAIAMRIAF
jgi:hypothetical protein